MSHSHFSLSATPNFSPDWCFGLFKQLFKRTKMGSLHSIAQIANDSAECNFAQLVFRKDVSTIVLTSGFGKWK